MTDAERNDTSPTGDAPKGEVKAPKAGGGSKTESKSPKGQAASKAGTKPAAKAPKEGAAKEAKPAAGDGEAPAPRTEPTWTAARSGDLMRSDWPTRMRVGSSRLFHCASSR